MTMTWNEIVDLLAFCAVHDKRKGDDTDVKAWLMVATDQGWTREAALRVARDHYGRGADRPRLEPAAITDRIRAMRSRAAETFEAPRIPDDLPNADYPAWLRAQLAAHIDRKIEAWAVTGEEPSLSLPPAGPSRTLPELVAGAPDHVRAELRRALPRAGRRMPRRDGAA